MPALIEAKRMLLAKNPCLARKIEASIDECCKKITSKAKALDARGVFLTESNALRARTMCRLELHNALSPACLSLADPVATILHRAVPPNAALRCAEALADDLAGRAAACGAAGSGGLPSDRTLQGGAAVMAASAARAAGEVEMTCSLDSSQDSRAAATSVERLSPEAAREVHRRSAWRLGGYRRGVARLLRLRAGDAHDVRALEELEAHDLLDLLRAGLLNAGQPAACTEESEETCTVLVRA
jgi:hypothetical protein